MEEIVVRNAIETDIPNIALLLRELGWFLLIAENKRHDFFGYCFIHLNMHLFLAGPEAYISDLFVREKYRGQGVGRKLIQAVLNIANDNQCGRVGLLNNRDRESYHRKFYEKMGFMERSNMADFIIKLK